MMTFLGSLYLIALFLQNGLGLSALNTARQLGTAVGVAILSTVASAVGLTEQVAGRTAPHLTAYHTGLATDSVIALLAAAAQAVSAGCHHPSRLRPAARAGR